MVRPRIVPLWPLLAALAGCASAPATPARDAVSLAASLDRASLERGSIAATGSASTTHARKPGGPRTSWRPGAGVAPRLLADGGRDRVPRDDSPSWKGPDGNAG